MVEHSLDKREVVGSNPSASTIFRCHALCMIVTEASPLVGLPAFPPSSNGRMLVSDTSRRGSSPCGGAIY